MIKVKIMDPDFNNAYCNAMNTLPDIQGEKPRQYFQRWQENFNCRISGEYVIFDRDEDYTWFTLKWS
jgi:hypothetical protein